MHQHSIYLHASGFMVITVPVFCLLHIPKLQILFLLNSKSSDNNVKYIINLCLSK